MNRQSRPALLMLTKLPEPGAVKTRLCPPLTPAEAAALQRACLQDIWSRVAALRGVHRVLCHHPPQAGPQFSTLLGPNIELLAQAEGDLGQRRLAAFAALFARGFGPIVAVASDSPDLPLDRLAQAHSALATGQYDVVLGPAVDGGYTLLGLNQPHRAPFEMIPWSTFEVVAVTQERCRQAGLRVLSLAPWSDVDDAASLARLRESVQAHPTDLPHLHRWFHAREKQI